MISMMAILLFLLVSLWRSDIVGSEESHNWKRTSAEDCTDKKRKSIIFSDGSFITRDEAKWIRRHDGSMEYRPNSCQLKRFTHTEALTCLNHRHVLFIGDSLSRFQYLSLAYFIEHGEWLAKFRMNRNCSHFDENNVPQCRKPGAPNLNDPYNRNYRDLHIDLGNHFFNGKMECQCYRGRVEKSVENMYYQTRINNTSVKLTFLSDIVVFPMKGWNRTHCSRTATCSMNLAKWYDFGRREWDYEYYDDDPRLYDYMAEHLVPDADIAIINRGLWTGIPTNYTSLPIIFKKVSEFIKKNSGRCFWKGTTVPMEPKMTELVGYFPTPETFTQLERHIRDLSHQYMCESFDLSHVTSDFVDLLGHEPNSKLNVTWNPHSRYVVDDVYIDRVHFQPWVYEEFNQILLNILC